GGGARAVERAADDRRDRVGRAGGPRRVAPRPRRRDTRVRGALRGARRRCAAPDRLGTPRRDLHRRKPGGAVRPLDGVGRRPARRRPRCVRQRLRRLAPPPPPLPYPPPPRAPPPPPP